MIVKLNLLTSRLQKKKKKLDVSRIETILIEVGQLEDGILRKRRQREQRQRENRRRDKIRRIEYENQVRLLQGIPSSNGSSTDDSNRSVAEQLRQSLSANPSTGQTSEKQPTQNNSGDDDEPPDNVRLGEEGWKERYYQTKFGVSSNDSEFKKKIARAYVEGLEWVMRYYYQGCCSWRWFYPFHYAPFASDLESLPALFPTPSSFDKGLFNSASLLFLISSPRRTI